MLEKNILLVISLLFIVSLLSMLSRRLKIAYPIFLVLSGLVISLIPGTPHIALKPELIFIIFLPPLLYSAALDTSWREFWFLRRPIASLAFGLVLSTSLIVAVVAKNMIPGFTLALGFLLGGIISPPDAVAATSVTKGLKVPKRVISILEGESLVNDASSLIVFRFALAAILTGMFSMLNAGKTFFIVAIIGILVGLVVGYILYLVHKYLPTTASIDTALSIVGPYLSYIVAEQFHASGVLAVVTTGLFITYRAHEIFSYNSRLQMQSVWNTLVFLMNGFVFIVIGLQLKGIVSGLAPDYSLGTAIFYALIIALVTIGIRIFSVFYRPVLWYIIDKNKFLLREHWKSFFVVAWSGMRGVVSLAAALSIPLTLKNGDAFPHRDLILFITFVVILVTLVLQGLSLPFIVKWLKIDIQEQESQQIHEMHIRLATHVLEYIDSNYAEKLGESSIIKSMRERYESLLNSSQKWLSDTTDTDPDQDFSYLTFLLEIVNIKRTELNSIRNEKKYAEEAIKKIEREIDIEEARVRWN